MCATRNHTETIPASQLRPGDTLLDSRHFRVGTIKVGAGGRLKLEAERGLADPIWVEPTDHIQVVAA